MPFIEPADMDTAEPLPGWKGRFWRSGSMSFSHYDVEVLILSDKLDVERAFGETMDQLEAWARQTLETERSP